jgi:sulfur carrier protein
MSSASPSTGSVLVNGDSHELAAGCTIRELLERLDLGGRKVAVALNRNVVPRSHYATTTLAAGDRVEILEAVGGG